MVNPAWKFFAIVKPQAYLSQTSLLLGSESVVAIVGNCFFAAFYEANRPSARNVQLHHPRRNRVAPKCQSRARGCEL